MDYDHLDPEGSLMDVRRISIVPFNVCSFLQRYFFGFLAPVVYILLCIHFSIINRGFKP